LRFILNRYRPERRLIWRGRIVKDGVQKALRDRQLALTELVHAIKHFRQIADSKPLTLQGSDYAHSVHPDGKGMARSVQGNGLNFNSRLIQIL
jgi:hypothetical protein